uniref:Pectinesterase inhibitor domain-containing protein n=1 Tax=Leersia perrieri TaxID=77586 RepID=A0A0D9VTH6_9ORYZ
MAMIMPPVAAVAVALLALASLQPRPAQAQPQVAAPPWAAPVPWPGELDCTGALLNLSSCLTYVEARSALTRPRRRLRRLRGPRRRRPRARAAHHLPRRRAPAKALRRARGARRRASRRRRRAGRIRVRRAGNRTVNGSNEQRQRAGDAPTHKTPPASPAPGDPRFTAGSAAAVKTTGSHETGHGHTHALHGTQHINCTTVHACTHRSSIQFPQHSSMTPRIHDHHFIAHPRVRPVGGAGWRRPSRRPAAGCWLCQPHSRASARGARRVKTVNAAASVRPARVAVVDAPHAGWVDTALARGHEQHVRA